MFHFVSKQTAKSTKNQFVTLRHIAHAEKFTSI